MKKLSKGTIAAIIGGALVLVLAIVYFAISNSVNNTGYKKEAVLNVQYLDNQNHLSDCIVKIRETANVTQAESKAFTDAMSDAVKGRYDGRQANPGQMFSAIVENYPDLSGLNKAFERAYKTIMGCRSDYRNKQSKLLDMLGQYDSWRTGSFTVRTFGGSFPSDNLVAQIGSDRSRKGRAALDQMYTIVTVKDAQKATESGTLDPEQPFPVGTPTR